MAFSLSLQVPPAEGAPWVRVASQEVPPFCWRVAFCFPEIVIERRPSGPPIGRRSGSLLREERRGGGDAGSPSAASPTRGPRRLTSPKAKQRAIGLAFGEADRFLPPAFRRFGPRHPLCWLPFWALRPLGEERKERGQPPCWALRPGVREANPSPSAKSSRASALWAAKCLRPILGTGRPNARLPPLSEAGGPDGSLRSPINRACRIRGGRKAERSDAHRPTSFLVFLIF